MLQAEFGQSKIKLIGYQKKQAQKERERLVFIVHLTPDRNVFEQNVHNFFVLLPRAACCQMSKMCICFT